MLAYVIATSFWWVPLLAVIGIWIAFEIQE